MKRSGFLWSLAAPILLSVAACKTLEAVSDEIDDGREPAAARAGEERPPLPAEPLDAIARLEARGADPAGLLRRLLAEGDEPVRVRAATALGRLDVAATPSLAALDPATSALCEALADPSAKVRAAAAFALGVRGDTAAKDALLEHWMDRDATVRARIVEAASRIESPALHAEVLTALDDPSLEVRCEAAVGPHRWPVEPWPRNDGAADRVDERLIARAQERGADPELVWRVLFTLQRRKSVMALPLYVAHVEDEDVRARLFAVRGLAGFPRTGADLLPRDVSRHAERLGTALRERLKDPDWRVACEAATGLGDPGPLLGQGTIVALERALAHDSTHVGVQAALALGAYKKRHAVREALEATATEVDDPAVAKAIRERAQDPAREALVAAAGGRSRHVAAAAVEALGCTDASGWEPFVESDDPLVRAAVARGLRDCGGQREAANALVRLSYDESKRVAGFAVESLGGHLAAARARLHELCTSADNGLRLAAVIALREGPSLADLPFLERAFDTAQGDIGEEVRFNALKTAALLPDDVGLALLNKGVLDESPYVSRFAGELLRADGWTVPARARPVTDVTAEPPAGDALAHRRAEVVTSRGTLVFELFPDETPRHVENFVRLAESGYYEGTVFHRVVPDFVVQGGDYRGDGNGAKPWNGRPLRREVTPRKFVRGSLGMPRNEDPDSGGSQIFVTHRETPHLDGRYALFGQLVEGFDVLDRIVALDTIERVVVR